MQALSSLFSCVVWPAMSLEEQQRQLASLWVSGRIGNLGPWSQAKVWALKEVWAELHPGTTHVICPLYMFAILMMEA